MTLNESHQKSNENNGISNRNNNNNIKSNPKNLTDNSENESGGQTKTKNKKLFEKEKRKNYQWKEETKNEG
ncbi:hypothetical protein H8356DRAFT_1334659 [Neocallimastix lanati (nom. inval.)]|nr:hypothetical protein H8356DRAFT_1334659 [Neocallimastix sp. JGI-2020a]